MLSNGSLEMIAWCAAGCPLPGEQPKHDKLVKIDHERGVANDPASLPDDCIGSLIDPDGGVYLPWGPYLSPDDARRMRGELVVMIEELARLECWPRSLLDEVLTAAVRGPLSALMPDLHHFKEQLATARAEAAARAALDRCTWHGEGFDDRRLAGQCKRGNHD
jgi:hypothetical protein